MTTPRRLSDRYDLGETLGFGGMSEVHQARDLLLHRDVAIKVLRADLARDPSFYLRFRREAQNAAALNHPTIVSVFDTGEAQTADGPLPFIVMEFVDGQTFRDVLRSQGQVSPRQAMTWMADVAAALDFSHQNGIVHRDMKPANVMIDKTGAVKVMDFGIARAMADTTGAMTQTSAVIGTAQYLSPEQARGGSVDARSDVYSMGCVLFELITGQPPFNGDSPVAIAYQHVREDPPIPSSLRREIPPTLDSVVMKAMAKNPANRYQSAGEFRSDLVKVLTGARPSAPMLLSEEEKTNFIEPVRVRPRPDGHSRRVEPDGGDGHRRGLLRALGVAAAVLAVVVAVVLLLTRPWASDSDEVAIPDVTSMSQAQARTTLHDNLGFKVTVQNEASTEVASGSPVRTTPGQGVKADKGSEVTLYISSGPPRHNLPDLNGQTLEQAKDRLGQLGFKNVASDVVPSGSDLQGKVVSLSPATGTSQVITTKVTVHIGSGPKLVDIPSVIGQTLSDATKTLKDLNLTVESSEVDSAQPNGTVVAATPSAGSQADEGSTVTLQVSRGNQFKMPDLTGKTRQQAQDTLAAAGWKKTTLTQTPRDVGLTSPNAGRIISQTPRPNDLINNNAEISVVVGRTSLLPG